jgi:hypothetical protein
MALIFHPHLLKKKVNYKGNNLELNKCRNNIMEIQILKKINKITLKHKIILLSHLKNFLTLITVRK